MTESNLGKKRWLCLFVLVLLPFMATLDANIINVALPTISKDLNIAMAEVEWVVTIYLIVISATIIIFGKLGDIKGKTRIFKIGFLLFTVGSLLCGLSHSFEFLIFSRVVQSIGASCAMATNQGIITQIFPAGERGRALGISGMAVALGTMTGSPLGGLIISITNWQVIFLVNIPVGIVAAILAFTILPHETGNEKEKLTPLLDVRIFKNSLFTLSVLCSFLAFAAISSMNIIQPFYLQDILLLSAGAAGLFMMVAPIVTFVTSPVSGYMSDKIGSEGLTFIGLCVETAGLVLLSTLKEVSPLLSVGFFVGLAAFGSALFQSPNTSLIMSTVAQDKLGVAGSINALVRNMGMTVGILVSTGVLYNRMSANLGEKVLGYVAGEQTAFIYGMHWAYMTAALICAAGAVLTGIRIARKVHKKSA